MTVPFQRESQDALESSCPLTLMEFHVALTITEVARLADLARIEMTEEELSVMTGQLDVILDAVAVVSEAARADVAPTSHALDLTNVFREDEVKPSLTPEEVLAMAPAVEEGRFRVPRILQEEA